MIEIVYIHLGFWLYEQVKKFLFPEDIEATVSFGILKY
jgi:hypothetical protein